MLPLIWKLSAALNGYMRFYMPTNRVVDWLRGPGGLKWAVPVALVATPTYLFAMSVCATMVQRGRPGYLNVLVMLFAWNSMKFACIAVVGPFLYVGYLRARRSSFAGTQTGAVWHEPIPR